MLTKIATFLNMLSNELNDLEENVKLLLDDNTKRHEKGELTNYVFLENRATEENEILRIKHLKEIINKLNPRDYNSLDDIINKVLNLIEEEINKEKLSGFPMEIIRKKIEKIKNYIEN